MNYSIFGALALFAFVTESKGQIGAPFGGQFGGAFGGQMAGPFGGQMGSPFGAMFIPPAASAGWMAAQESSKNAVNIAVNSAISKVNVTELSPELQVCVSIIKL